MYMLSQAESLTATSGGLLGRVAIGWDVPTPGSGIGMSPLNMRGRNMMKVNGQLYVISIYLYPHRERSSPPHPAGC
jgi:hypothetical protein